MAGELLNAWSDSSVNPGNSTSCSSSSPYGSRTVNVRMWLLSFWIATSVSSIVRTSTVWAAANFM